MPARSTQANVARAAGVSVATVSYVASGRRDRKSAATPEIIARVQQAMRELDYTPARAGRVLARNRTGLVAVVAYTPFNPWALELITQVEEVAADHGLGVIIQRYGHTDHAADRAEAQLIDGIADAAIVLGAAGFGSARLRRIGRKLPLLAIGEWYRPRGFDVMVQQETAAVEAAADHLITLGVQRPAFLTAATTGSSPMRRDAFVKTFEDNGYPARAITTTEQPEDAFSTFLDTRHLAIQLLDRPSHQRPDAIMASSDRAAISTLWAALQLEIAIPADLKVIGAGNIPEGATLAPALTTIGTAAAAYRPVLERLLARIEKPEMATRTIRAPWRLIRRETA